jgi:uncharacterized paraquat-inducible protein A
MPEVIEQPKQAEKPWKGLCCSRCYKAQSEKKKCRCRCHSQYHGLGRKKVDKGVANETDKSVRS